MEINVDIVKYIRFMRVFDFNFNMSPHGFVIQSFKCFTYLFLENDTVIVYKLQ